MIGWRDAEGTLHRGTVFGVFAALALIRAGQDALPTDEAAWHDLLLALTGGQPEPWQLVVDDWSKPALLQPPVVADANRADYKSRLPTPDALDMLVTSKNHDVKGERIAEASEEDWLFALVTLQTTEGFLGAGNYGISRMNGGFATRMSLGVRPGGGAAGAFRRDVQRLVADARGRTEPRGDIALLWTVPWDGTQSLRITDLDPLYVEICRRVRLRHGARGIEALAAGSKCARVAAADLKGRTDDPWAPMKADGSTSHTPTGRGFGYRQIANLLNPEKITAPPLAHVGADDDRAGLSIVAAALVRGQGKTEGLHRRAIRTSRVETLYEGGPTRVLDAIGNVASRRSDEASEAGRRLRRALILLVQGGPDQARLDDDAANRKVDPWIGRFDALVDRDFFADAFWAEAAGDTAGSKRGWREQLRDHAFTIFAEAAEAAPRTAMRRVRAIARSRSMLEVQMYRWVKEVADGE